MPIARFETPDGRVARFEVPEGTTPDQAMAMMAQEFPNLAPREQPATATEKFLGNPVTRAALGASSVLTAPFQLGANIGDKAAEAMGLEPVVGKWTNEKLAELEAMKSRGMAARSGRPIGEEWDVAGGIGSLIPATGVYKGIAKALPKAISTEAPSLTGRTIGRMVAGGGTAASTIPDTSGGEDYLSDKAVQTGIGAAVPVGMAALGSILKGTGKIIGQSVSSLKDTIKNFTESGQKVLADQHLRKLAEEGGEPALKKTIDSLLNEKRIIGKITSSEAIASGNIGKGARHGGPIVRLQSELANLPETTTKLRSIEAAQEQIRKSALKSIARGQTEESVLAERAAASTKNYGKAFKEAVQSDGELKSLMSRPSMKDVLRRANELAQEQGKKFKIGVDSPETIVTGKLVDKAGKPLSTTIIPEQVSKYPVESLHFMKMAMDDLIKNPERFGIGASEVRAITQTQNQFVKWLGQKSHAYNFARQEHKKLSEVLNRVQVRDTLEKILTGPRGEERTAQFLNATREIPKTFKKATGSNRFDKIEDILPSHEAKMVNKIVKELERDAMATKMTREVNIPGATSPVTGNMAQLPSPLYRPTMVANWILKRGGEEGNKNVNRIAADILSDPKRAAEVLSKVPPQWKQDVTKALQDFQRFAQDPANVAAIQAAGGTNGR
ncbi:MAG: hypothetical protein NUV80_03750 [Candidatus Berkelbacteria bacterium]|nr:hypothetical protein [Candidatus Berkelbacteria bacterium]